MDKEIKIMNFAMALTKSKDNIINIKVELKEESTWYLVTFSGKDNRQTSISVEGIMDEEWGKINKLLDKI
jgi:hypothetical protein